MDSKPWKTKWEEQIKFREMVSGALHWCSSVFSDAFISMLHDKNLNFVNSEKSENKWENKYEQEV